MFFPGGIKPEFIPCGKYFSHTENIFPIRKIFFLYRKYFSHTENWMISGKVWSAIHHHFIIRSCSWVGETWSGTQEVWVQSSCRFLFYPLGIKFDLFLFPMDNIFLLGKIFFPIQIIFFPIRIIFFPVGKYFSVWDNIFPYGKIFFRIG